MSKASDAKAKFEKDFKSGKMTKVTGDVGTAKKLAIKAGGKVLAAVAGKKAATKAVAVSSRNAVKAAETRAALKSAKSKPPLATPKSNVKVTKPVLNSGARNANEQGRIADMRYSADHARALAEKRVAALKLAKKSKVIKII